MNAQVFVSYASKDQTVSDWYCTLMEKNMRKYLALSLAGFMITFGASVADAQKGKGNSSNVKSRTYCENLATQRGFAAKKAGRGKFIRACRQGKIS